MLPYIRKILSGPAICAALILFSPLQVIAQEDAEITEEDEEDVAEKHFTKGRQLSSQGKHKEAIEQLLKAYELRPAPPLLLNIARTYEKLDEKANALKFYKEFLQKARLVDPNRPAVQEVVKKLERQVKEKTDAVTSAEGTQTPVAKETAADAAFLPKRKEQLIHTPVDSAKVNKPITIMAEMPPGLQADRVVLHFRKGGETSFVEIEMELQGEAHVARIPAKYVTSTSLQYFIQASKGTGKRSVVAVAGTKTTPHIVVIEGGRSPHLGPVKEVEIRSPYRTWMWVSAAVTASMVGGGVATAMLARDRENAMERWVREKSCDETCQRTGFPKLSFAEKARDWESEGNTFALLSRVLIGLSVAAAGATGYLWYKDRRYVQQERAKKMASSSTGIHWAAAPWSTRHGAGFVGRIDF